MDAEKVKKLLELIEKVSVPPPGMAEGELPERNQAIIAKAEAEIDAELEA